MALAHPRRALAGVATSLVAACLVVSGSTPAFADHVRNHEWWLRALHVIKAWQSSHGQGVTVAVLGTGVDAQHADLVGSVVTGPDYTGSGEVPYSAYWGVSGTASASLIAGHGHGPAGSSGIVGIAPAARILSVRVTLEGSDPLLTNSSVAAGLPDAIARGIRYAVRHHASVIDLPLDPVTTPGAAGAGGSPAERAAVKYALAHQVVLVAPAGDNGAGADAVNYPAAYPGVISVGAFGSSFVKGTFSSRQPYVTLTAPGVNVLAAQPPPPAGAPTPSPTASPSPQGPYAIVNSTSGGSAIVAGIAALIRSQFPQMTPHQVLEALTRGARYHRPGGRHDGSGYGTADAALALVQAARIMEASGATPAAAPAPPTPPAIRPTGQSFSQMIRNDAGVAGAVFFVLLAAILALGWVQRRRARAARLAQVRAAALPLQPLRPGPAPADAPGFRDGSAASGRPSALRARDGAGEMGEWEPRPDNAPGGVFQSTMFARSMGSGADRDGANGPGDLFRGPGAASGSALPARLSAPAPGRSVISGTVVGGTPPGFADPASGGPGTSGPGGPGAGGAGPGGPSAGAAGGIAAMRALGAHRLPARTPRVSGSPPWEPAARPDGEVPWARTPSSSPLPPSPPPDQAQEYAPEQDLSVWDVIAEEVWPGGPRTGPPTSQPGDEPADEPPSASGEGDLPGPIYTWNPGASTDTFPAIRPDA